MTPNEQNPTATPEQPSPDVAEDHRPPPPDEHRPAPPDPRPAPPQSTESRPPPPQLQVAVAQPPPPQQRSPEYQQPFSVYTSQSQSQYQYQQQNRYQQPGYQQAPSGPQTVRRSPWPIAVAAIALLIPVGIGGWYAFGRNDPTPEIADKPNDRQTTEPDTSEPSPTDQPDETEADTTEATDDPRDVFPTAPELRHSIQLTGDSEDESWSVPFAGTADDFLIAERSKPTSVVTRYIDGQPVSKNQVGREVPAYFSWEGDLLLYASHSANLEWTGIARLNPEDGTTIWELKSSVNMSYRVIDSRLFVIEQDWGGGGTASLIEYDPATGTELDRIAGPAFEWLHDEFILVDEAALTVQALGLDLQPDGDPIAVEPSGSDGIVVSRHEGNWLYYTNRADSVGQPTVVGLSPTGEKLFECATTIGDAKDVRVRDGSTMIVDSWNGGEVFDIDGSSCTSRWSRIANDYEFIFLYDEYPTVKKTNDYRGAIEVLDWETGKTLAIANESVHINGDDQMITFADGQLVSKALRTGEVQWTVDAYEKGSVGIDNGVIIVAYPGGADIYSD